MDSDEIDVKAVSLLFEIKKNQLKMVQRRGYDISKEKNILETTLQHFMDAYIPFAKSQNKSLRDILSRVYEAENGKRITVYYADSSKDSKQLGAKEIKPLADMMNEMKIHDAIIITSKPLSTQAAKDLNGLVRYNIQIFSEEEMGYDPTEHFLVPKHIPLTDQEQKDFLTKNNLSVDEIPILLTTDMISRYYGLRAGRIVRIERENMFPTMILKSVSYRVVKDEIIV